MALSKGDTQNSNKLYVLKIKTKDVDGKPVPVFFQVAEKNPETGKWTPTGEMKNVTGNLVSVQVTDEDYNGEKYNAVKLTLEDPDAKESYILDTRFNMLSRSLLNSLCSLTNYDDLKIGVYQSSPKPGFESQASVSVRQGDQKVSWAFAIADQPKVTEVKAGAKVIRVYDDLNNFFIEKVKDLNEKVKAARKSKPAKVKEVAPVASDPDDL